MSYVMGNNYVKIEEKHAETSAMRIVECNGIDFVKRISES